METVLVPIANTLFGAGGAAAGGAATASTASSVLTGAAIGSTAASLAASLQKRTGSPGVKSPTPMPTVDDARVREASRRRMMELQARSGRASTIFTEDKLGG